MPNISSSERPLVDYTADTSEIPMRSPSMPPITNQQHADFYEDNINSSVLYDTNYRSQIPSGFSRHANQGSGIHETELEERIQTLDINEVPHFGLDNVNAVYDFDSYGGQNVFAGQNFLPQSDFNKSTENGFSYDRPEDFAPVESFDPEMQYYARGQHFPPTINGQGNLNSLQFVDQSPYYTGRTYQHGFGTHRTAPKDLDPLQTRNHEFYGGQSQAQRLKHNINSNKTKKGHLNTDGSSFNTRIPEDTGAQLARNKPYQTYQSSASHQFYGTAKGTISDTYLESHVQHSGSISVENVGSQHNMHEELSRNANSDEYRPNKSPKKLEMKDIMGNAVEFSRDQYGSRFLQQRLENAAIEDRRKIFDEVAPSALQLMTDVFGNYVIQKLFEYGELSQKTELFSRLKGNILELSLQMYGCRVIQKVLYCLSN
jgi:hypothetical protein